MPHSKLGSNFVATLFVALGDPSEIDFVPVLSEENAWLFWICWFIVVISTSIVMLNFVIAEATYVYDTVSDRLNEFILKDRAGLINEADEMKPFFFKGKDRYPKYIIIREVSMW